MKNILILPRITIHNANAFSSPYSVGFPAMTAWLGGVHALQRHLNKQGFTELLFTAATVVCHKLNLQTYKGEGDYVRSIIGTGNPLVLKGTKSDPAIAERAPFIEEARCHLEVSVVIEYKNCSSDKDEFVDAVNNLVAGKIKFAGGDVLGTVQSRLLSIDDTENLQKLVRLVMPGFCLIERRDLMKKSMEEGKDAIDSLLEYLAVHHTSSIDGNGKTNWISRRQEKGWIVPISVGYQGITDLGHVESQRDPEVLHRFAEAVVTLGEFIMPYRFNKTEDMLWVYDYDKEKKFYLCKQQKDVNKQ